MIYQASNSLKAGKLGLNICSSTLPTAKTGLQLSSATDLLAARRTPRVFIRRPHWSESILEEGLEPGVGDG